MGERIETAWMAGVKTGGAWAARGMTETAWTVGVRSCDAWGTRGKTRAASLNHWKAAWVVVSGMDGTAKLMDGRSKAAKLTRWKAAWAVNVEEAGRRDQTAAGSVTGTTAVVAARPRQYAVAVRQYDLAGRPRQYEGMQSGVPPLSGLGESCSPLAVKVTGAATRDAGWWQKVPRGGEMETRAMAAVICARCAGPAEEELT